VPLPLPVPTPIATGFGVANGGAYRRSTDQLFVVESGSGTISVVNVHAHTRTVLGTGYNAPHDIVLSADGLHAYVAESPGTLLRIALSSPNRASASVVCSGLNGIQQIALDEAHGFAYVAEFTASRLMRISLVDGSRTAVPVPGLSFPRGVLLTKDARFVYVSGDSDKIIRFDLMFLTATVVASGLNAPRYLTWADAGEGVILFPQPNPVGTVYKLDLTASPPAVTAITATTPHDPYTVTVLSPDKLLITSFDVVSQVDLTSSVYTAAGPILLGIGFVPADIGHLPNGYADTSMDTGYFFQVHDCPFGGTLPLMINWQHAHSMGANFYQVFITAGGGPAVQVTLPFSDYLWSVPLNAFELVTTAPVGGFYPLRAAGQIWLNSWLGLMLDTTGRPNTLNTISVKLFAAQNPASEIGHATDAGRFATVMIDNTVPTANLEQILHGGVPVATCEIVNTLPHTFTFVVTASAPRHLKGWNLYAYWGDDKGKVVAEDDYSHHVTATRLWTGLASTAVPPPGPSPWEALVVGDPTSIHCAHTFWLYAWDRVVNGWNYIHGAAGYHKSITLMF
jgi:hypothetical protein